MSHAEGFLTLREAARRTGASIARIERLVEEGVLEAEVLVGGAVRVRAADLWERVRETATDPAAELDAVPLRVLVIEDEKRLGASIRRVLSRVGYHVRVARDGFRAAALVASFRPSVITLDLRMPAIDGHEVMTLLKGSPSAETFRVLVISAEGDEAIAEAIALGADDFLEKPFENEALVRKVEALMPAADFVPATI